MTDPRNPHETDHDDDAIGFASPRSLQPAPPPPLSDGSSEPGAFPSVAEESVAPAPPTEAQTFPAADRFEPARVADVVPPPAPAASPSPQDEPVGVPGATRPFDRVLGGADDSLRQLGGERVALAGYVCLIGAILTGGALIAVTLFLAHRTRRTAEDWVRSHVEYQRKTAVVGVIGVIVGLATLPIGFGVFIVTLAIVWAMVRGVTGLMKFLKRRPLGAVPLWSLP